MSLTIHTVKKLFGTDWFCLAQLDSSQINYLWNCVGEANKKSINYSSSLAGSISSSLLMDDPSGILLREILPSLLESNDIKELVNDEISRSLRRFPALMLMQEKKFSFRLDEIWVNYQRKHEYNPIHDHAGLLSFTIWMRVPFMIEDEDNVDHSLHSKSTTSAASFGFIDSSGCVHMIRADKKFEGTICIFPSTLKHLVYPFFTSDDKRISIAGNISLDIH